MVDRSILIRVLDILDRLDGVSLAEHVLVDEVAISTARPVSSDEIRENIRHAVDKGWVEKSVGLVRETRLARTPAGKAALRDLRTP